MSSPESQSVEIVSSRSHYRDFFSLKKKIYQDDPAVVFSLPSIERMQLDVNGHPFYEHASRQMFVCYRNRKPVGRIVAIKDELHNQHNDDRVGFFGFFEAIDDQPVVESLLDSAADWLRDHGCDTMRGPVNPSMKSDFGVVVEGNELPPMVMMGYSPKRYQRHFLDAGLDLAKRFFAYHYYSSDFAAAQDRWEHLDAASKKILRRYPQIEMRSASKETFDQTMRDVNELANVVRANGWGFVPLTEAELAFMISNLRRVIRYDMIHLAYWEGQLVGYIVSIPDVNWALKRAKGPFEWIRMLRMPGLMRKTPHSRVIALGVDNNFRNKGIASLLIHQLVKNYDAFDQWEFSWVDEENLPSIRIIARTIPLARSKTYELYQKSI